MTDKLYVSSVIYDVIERSGYDMSNYQIAEPVPAEPLHLSAAPRARDKRGAKP